MDLILARENGAEVAVIPWNADFECGGSNTFEIEIPKRIWKGIESFYDLVYVPGTEFGGMIGEIVSENEPNSIFLRGDTWRGMMTKKIIIPSAETHYYTAYGNSTEIIKKLLKAFFDDRIVQAAEGIGVQIGSYQFPRYCDLMTGINLMLATKEHTAKIRYVQTAASGYFEVGSSQIRNFSAVPGEEVEIRSDVRRNGINHLICLGKGQLGSRMVRHIYLDSSGNVTDRQVMKGRYEQAAVYDFSAAQDAADLIKSGTQYLQDLKSQTILEVTGNSIDKDREIGDLVRTTDPITGSIIWKHIDRKILAITGGIPRIEYKLEGEQ